jgi:hypothetical protein
MQEPSPSEFKHRDNHDGTFDSICLSCFATVCTACSESALTAAESTHGRLHALEQTYRRATKLHLVSSS